MSSVGWLRAARSIYSSNARRSRAVVTSVVHEPAPNSDVAAYGNAEVASWLVSQGAKVDITDSEGDTALSVCESAACADVLAAAGADIFHANNEGATAYHVVSSVCLA